MTIVEVNAERPYRVDISSGALEGLPELVNGCDRVAVLHPPTLTEQATRLGETVPGAVTIEVPDAESGKTSEVLVSVWDRLAELGFTRSDAVVGFGGGATTDLAGFVAATWLRGVRYVSVPTTVLGMVDAAVGGKTGINIPAGKNLVGAFHEPVGVLCDLDMLATLAADEIRAGLAEVVKCGFIADPEITRLIAGDPDGAMTPGHPVQAELITRGIRVKAKVVSGDLREATSSGSRVGRELLNYGHTLGHAIERAEGFTWRHGEAISVGMVYAAELAAELGWCDQDFVDLHRSQLTALGLPTRHEGSWEELRATMALDKKTRGSTLRFVLLHGAGQPEICVGPDEEALVRSYERVR